MLNASCRLAALAAALVLSSPATAKKRVAVPEAPMPAGYDDPGPKPEKALPVILADLRRTMKDPYSMRDFRLCEASVAQAFRYPGRAGLWQRARWTVHFALNAKNSYGGYAGQTYFTATFEGGKLTGVSSPDLGPELNRKLLGITLDCPTVPDAELQRLLAN
jgi:hypothetical protein